MWIAEDLGFRICESRRRSVGHNDALPLVVNAFWARIQKARAYYQFVGSSSLYAAATVRTTSRCIASAGSSATLVTLTVVPSQIAEQRSSVASRDR